MEPQNMNALWVEDQGSVNGDECIPRDNSTDNADGSVKLYFRDLEKHLVGHIEEASMVLGCVA